LETELNDLRYIARHCQTKTGLRRLRKTLREALPTEYRPA
jgi:hypothetical protein